MSKAAKAIEGEVIPNAGKNLKVQEPAQGAALIQMIERVALTPSADLDKLERLIHMQERVMAQQAKSDFTAALAAMQPELPVIPERGKIKIGSGAPQSYALWEDINEAIKPVLAKHGFALSFRTGCEADKIIVTGILSHKEGHSEETTMHLPIDATGSKNAVQAVGSSTSYGKRYTASALLNLTGRGEDDDGKAAGKPETITDAQAGTIKSLIVETNSDIAKFCAYFKIAVITDLPVKRFQEAMTLLNRKTRS